MSKNKKSKRSSSRKNTDILSGLQIPDLIQGASFDTSLENLDEIRSRIESGANNNLGRPVRVMFISEASFLHTGFATYAREILKRLQSDDRFECAELGSYADQVKGDSYNLPWKFYGGQPLATDHQAMEDHKKVKASQFGAGAFEHAVTDFQPDVVLLHRDHWMDAWVVNHPLASKFHTIWMACVDSYPQQWEWLKDYSKADTILAYADFGKKVMEEQSRTELARRHKVSPINVDQVCRAGVPLDEFFPIGNRNNVELKEQYGIDPKTKIVGSGCGLKEQYGIDPKMKIVGSVMRNQPRKLFPTIIEGFKNYLVETGDNNAMLLLHTGIPDVGFDIPEYIHRFGVNHKVLFSTICHQCDHNSVQLWGFDSRPCPNCGTTGSVRTCSTAKGLENKRFNEIYNLMDLYIQCSIAGADEMPATEAKAAGVPVACTEYAAMYEKAHSPGGFPLKVSTFFHEGETKQTRAYTDHKSITKVMKELLGSENRRTAAGQMGRKHVERYYDWNLTADKWKASILNATLKSEGWEPAEVTYAIVGSDETKIAQTKASLPSDADLQVVTDRSELSDGWTVVLEEGDVLYPGKSDLSKEVFFHGSEANNFMIPVLTQFENGTIDTHTPILESILLNVGEEIEEGGLIISYDEQAASILSAHRAMVENLDPKNEQQILNFRNTVASIGEVIRRHIASQRAYIMRRKNG